MGTGIEVSQVGGASVSPNNNGVFEAHYETGLEKLWGPGFSKLKQMVAEGYIEDHHLQKMSDPNKMNTKMVYNKYRHTHGLDFTLDQMLDSWYNNVLFNQTPKQAQNLLTRVLGESSVL